MADRSRKIMLRLALAAGVSLLLTSGPALADPLDILSKERWKKLRETEYYQLQVAEKYYRASEWKVAAAEYEKYLTLYERSEGAPYAQLKWSQCQIQLRNLNTAVKDGFKSVIDYWPDSPEAIASLYYIGQSYKNMGDIKPAKKAYAQVIAKHPKHLAAVRAKVDLIAIAKSEEDSARCVELWKQLTHQTERKGDARSYCNLASRELAQHYFQQGNFADGKAALLTTYKEEETLPANLMHGNVGRLGSIVAGLTGNKEQPVRDKGLKLADAAIRFIRTQIPTDLKEKASKDRARLYWFYIADLHANARRPEEQRQVFEQMIKLLPGEDDLLGRLATWYKANGKRHDDARRIYASYGNKIEGQGLIAQSYREEKKIDPALKIFRQLTGQDKEHAVRWLGEVASTYRYTAGKPDLAIGVYREMIAVDPGKAPDYQWEIAGTLYSARRWQEALKAYRSTDKLPATFFQLAACHENLKQYNEAIALYRQIIVTHPSSASKALLKIGYAFENAGKKEAAIKTFQQVCARFPKHDEASKAHVHLNKKYKIRTTLGGATDK